MLWFLPGEGEEGEEVLKTSSNNNQPVESRSSFQRGENAEFSALQNKWTLPSALLNAVCGEEKRGSGEFWGAPREWDIGREFIWVGLQHPAHTSSLPVWSSDFFPSIMIYCVLKYCHWVETAKCTILWLLFPHGLLKEGENQLGLSVSWAGCAVRVLRVILGTATSHQGRKGDLKVKCLFLATSFRVRKLAGLKTGAAQRARRDAPGYGRALFLVSMQIKTEMTTCMSLFSACSLRTQLSACVTAKLWALCGGNASWHQRRTCVRGLVGSAVFGELWGNNPGAINLFSRDKKASRWSFCSLTGTIILRV